MSQSRSPHRVWVLGAGFSRALGGPLLPDLLYRRMPEEIEWVVKGCSGYQDVVQSVQWAHDIFHFGKDKQRNLWQDAEGFLVGLDYATNRSLSSWRGKVSSAIDACGYGPNSHLAEFRERDPVPLILDKLWRAARLALIIDCSSFLSGTDLDNMQSDETWLPYLDWARRLTENDTVISFNYDGVLDMLAGAPGTKIEIMPPARANTQIAAQQALTSDGLGATVLKVHGSVHWVQSGVNLKPPRISAEQADNTIIGVPGLSKQDVTMQLKPLWDRALTAIQEAREIFFIGYRFPESDPWARRAILNAIRFRHSDSYRLHVVLGPNLGHPDVLRMKALLSMAGGLSPKQIFDNEHGARPIAMGRSLIVHPLWAQDFIAEYQLTTMADRILPP